jgi:hypothetical protein
MASGDCEMDTMSRQILVLSVSADVIQQVEPGLFDILSNLPT